MAQSFGVRTFPSNELIPHIEWGRVQSRNGTDLARQSFNEGEE